MEVQEYTSDIQRRSGEIFSSGKDIFRAKNFLLLMTIEWVSTLADWIFMAIADAVR